MKKHLIHSLLILQVCIYSFQCKSNFSLPKYESSVNSPSWFSTQSNTNYDFDGNISQVIKEMAVQPDGVIFQPSVSEITGIVTVRSNWWIDFNGKTQKGVFFLQDKNAGIMVIHDIDTDSVASVGEKITINISKAANYKGQPSIVTFSKKASLSLFNPIYAQNGNSHYFTRNELSKVYTLEGVVLDKPEIVETSSFQMILGKSFKVAIQTSQGYTNHVQLGMDLVRGTLGGFNFDVLGETLFTLKPGQRVKITGPIYLSEGTIAIAVESKSQVEFLNSQHTPEVFSVTGSYNSTENSIFLNWFNPTSITGILVKRGLNTFPSDPWNVNDGVTIFDGFGSSAEEIDVTSGRNYQYTIFTYNSNKVYSQGIRVAIATPGTPVPNIALGGNCKIALNEIGHDPTPGNDFNGDGKVQYSDDEFIEIVAQDCGKLNISGWKLKIKNSVSDSIKHIFADGTILPNNSAIVVFGGGKPVRSSSLSYFGGSQVVTANQTGALDLFSTGGNISLFDSSGEMLDLVDFSSFSQNVQTQRKIPEVTGVSYTLSTNLVASTLKGTPGLRDDSTMWSAYPLKLDMANSYPKGGLSVSRFAPLIMVFNLPLESTAINTIGTDVKLFKDKNCILNQLTINSGNVYISNNKISIYSSLPFDDTEYCIFLSKNLQSKLSAIGNQAAGSTTMDNDIKISFTTKLAPDSSIQNLRAIGRPLNHQETKQVNLIIRSAIVTYIDAFGKFFIEKPNDGGIYAFYTSSSLCGGLSIGDVIDINVRTITSYYGSPQISYMSCYSKTGTASVPVQDLTDIGVSENVFGSSVSIMGSFVSSPTCTPACNIKILTHKGIVEVRHTGASPKFSAFTIDDPVKITGPMGQFFDTPQILIDSTLGSVTTPIDNTKPAVVNVKFNGSLDLSKVANNANLLQVTFSEKMKPTSFNTSNIFVNNIASILSFNGLTNNNFTANYTIALPGQNQAHKLFLFTGIADLAGNTLDNTNYSFTTVDPTSITKVILNELMCASAGGGASEDYIELYVTQGGPIGKWSIKEWSTSAGPATEYQFATGFTVQTGDYIVLHYDANNQGTFTQEDVAGATSSDSNGTDKTDGAWDVYTTNTSFTCTDNYIILENENGVVIDSGPLSNRDGGISNTMEGVYGQVKTNYAMLWNFTLSPTGSNDAAVQAEAPWNGGSSGNTLTSGQRDSNYTPGGGGIKDTNSVAEWCTNLRSMGTINVDCP